MKSNRGFLWFLFGAVVVLALAMYMEHADATERGGSNAANANAVAGASAGAYASAGVTNNISMTGGGGGVVQEAEDEAPMAYAPGLVTSGEDLCTVSAAGGGSGAGFGFSFGVTSQEKHCQWLKRVKLLYSMGEKEAAMAMACQNPDVRDAMAAAGKPCSGPAPVVDKSTPASTTRLGFMP